MANERSTDFILRAQVDQALQPLAQVTQRVKDLITVLNQQREAAQTGDTTLGAYAKALRDVEQASGDLLKQRAALDNFATRGQKVDTQQNVVDQRQQRRDEFAASSLSPLGERSDKDAAALARLDKSLASSQARLDTMTIAYQRATEQLQRLGVLTDQLAANQQRLRLDQANASISDVVLQASEALRAGQVTNDTLIATLRLGDVQKQVAAQNARDSAKFVADQEAARKAVIDLAEATRAQGAAAQLAVDTGTARNRQREEIEAAFAAHDAEQKLIADAKALQAEQERALQGAIRLWEAEQAGIEKARLAFEAFQAQVAKAVGQAQSGLANAASQTGVLGRQVPLPAPTLAAQVREALATPSSPGTGIGDLTGLQSEVARISAVVTSGGASIRSYADELRALDAVSREVVRQSQIVDSFQKQDKAARDAVQAVAAAVAELKNLEAAAKNSTPDNLSEVTSAIARKNQQIGSIESGTGLTANARAQQEALAREAAALQAIGTTANGVGDAMTRLTGVAVATSQTRQDILAKERVATEATINDITARAALLSTTALSTPTAASAVGAISGAGRSEIGDVTEATAKLDATIGKASMTAQGFNRTMDQVFAVQRQIASDASLIDSFNAQSAATAKANATYAETQAQLAKLAASAKAGTTSLAELQQAERANNAAAADLQKQVTLEAQLDAQLKNRKIDTTNLTAEVDRLVAASTRLADVQSRASQGKSTVFGLSTYQLENLSFQVNDVITQLSLGQGVLRTFEAQAGQIFQVFETSISAMYKLFFYALPAAAAIGVLILALNRLKDTADAQREFARLLNANADGLAYQAKVLTDTARIIEKYGVTFADATTAVKQFAHDGLSIESMLQFAKTAQLISDVTGVAFVDALKEVGKIATGSYSDIAALNDQYNFLHASELQAIKDAFDYGRAEDGRTIAIDAATKAFSAGRAQGIDPLHQGMKNLTEAWKEFLDAIGSTRLLTGLIGILTEITKLASESANAIRYILNPTQAEANTKVTLLQKALIDVKAKIDAVKTGAVTVDEPLAILEGRAKDLTRQLEEAIKARDKLATPGAGPVSNLPAGVSGTGALPTSFSSLPGPDSRISKTIPPEMISIIAAAAATAGVREADLQALYRNEAQLLPGGGYKTNAESGATGAFQLLPTTFQEVVTKFKGLFDSLSAMLGKKIDINTPEFNALAGALYFKQQSDVFGSPALGAAAYNMGPGRAGSANNPGTGLRGVLDGTKQLPSETAQYVSNFIASQQGAAGTLPGFQRNPNTTNSDATKNQAGIDAITKSMSADVDELLRGDARILSDQQRLSEFYKQKNEELDKILGAAPRSPELTRLFNQQIDQFANKLDDRRKREEDAANNAVTQIIKSAEDAVDKANKTDAAAQRRVVDRDFEARLSALNEQIAHGAEAAASTVARDALLKVRDQAREQATVSSDRAIVDTTVKTRDEQIAAVEGDLKTSAITLQQAFDRIALIVKTFKPTIDAAIGKSNADLTAQPQTPAIQEQLAKNAKIDTTGQKAFETVDNAGMAKINALLAARSDIVKELNDQVANGSKTQQQADAEQVRAYQRFKPQISDLASALQAQLDLQKANGTIGVEAYEKLSAAIQKAKTSTDDLTASQRKAGQEIENSIVNNALNGLNSIATAIGNVVAGTGKWSDVLASVGSAFANFAAGVLKDIAAMMAKQLILNALQSAGVGQGIAGFLGLGGAAAGAAAGGASAAAPVFIDTVTAIAHGGGIIGATQMSRPFNPALFVGAARAHSGAMVGLKSNEVPAILQTGEEVLTADNKRHINNAGKGQDNTMQSSSIRNVLVFSEDEIAGSMAGSPGEKVVMTHIRRNAPALRQLFR